MSKYVRVAYVNHPVSMSLFYHLDGNFLMLLPEFILQSLIGTARATASQPLSASQNQAYIQIVFSIRLNKDRFCSHLIWHQ